MRRAFFLATGLVALLLASCATTYQPMGATGGYRDFQTAGNQYTVYFNGNGYTSSDTVYQFFLTRAAELALNNHYTSFYVVKVQDDSTRQTVVVPGQSYTTSHVDVYRTWVRSRYGNIGFLDTVTEHSVTVSTPPSVYSYEQPGFRGEVMLVNEPLKGQPAPFDAQTVYKDGMTLKDRIDTENRDVTMAAGAAALAVIAITIIYG